MFERFPWLASYLSCFFFAVMAICIKLLAPHLSTAPLMFFRAAIPVLIFVPSLARRPGVWQQARQHRRALLGRGLAGSGSLLFYLLALQAIPVSEASLAMNTTPLWAALVAWLSLGEPLPRRMAWAFPFSFVGVFLVGRGSLHGDWRGYAAGVVSAILAGVAYSFIRRARELPAELIALAFTGTAALLAAPLALRHLPQLTTWDWELIWAMGLSGGAGQWLMTVGYRYNSAAVASTLGLATVGFTTVLAYFCLDERLAALQLLGLGLILSGTWAMVEKPDAGKN